MSSSVEVVHPSAARRAADGRSSKAAGLSPCFAGGTDYKANEPVVIRGLGPRHLLEALKGGQERSCLVGGPDRSTAQQTSAKAMAPRAAQSLRTPRRQADVEMVRQAEG
jgi:hypothetical protein